MAKAAKKTAKKKNSAAKAAKKDPGPEPGKPFLGQRTGLLAVVVVLGTLLYAIQQIYQTPDVKPGAPTVPPTAAVSQPDIGGPFFLVDHEGRPVTQDTFKGRFMLVYFGYTFCPDVCPTALTEMGSALDILGEDGAPVTPVFITIDPERDRPEPLKEYLAFFHPRLVGLTGTSEQVAAVAKVYKVFAAKAALEHEHEPGREHDAEEHAKHMQDPKHEHDPGHHHDTGDYLMDHTSIIYLMGPDGAYRAHFSHGADARAMAAKIREFL